MSNNCKGCIYHRPITGGKALKICHYAIDTGRLRDCPADNCGKKATGKLSESELKHRRDNLFKYYDI